MSTQVRVKAVYAHLDCLLTGIDRLKRAGLKDFQVMSPLPRHEIMEMMYEGKPSPVRWWTLTGALTGLTIGFLLPALTHTQWPMINPGGKPTISLPAFAVIMFECTILLGALATFAGMIFNSKLPSWGLDKGIQDPRFGDDKFGIVFTDADADQVDSILSIFNATGAIESTSGDDAIYEVPNA
jgi:hypothetical protein